MAAVGERGGRDNGAICWARILGAAALALALVLGVGAGQALAGSATLAWDANIEPDLSGYKIHYGTAAGNYTTHLDVGNVTSYTVTGLTDGATYYFAATAYDTVGNESGYSNEVPHTVPGIAEMNLLGSTVVIIDGDSTPSATDNTDFGSSAVGIPVTRTFTIQNTGSGPLNLTGNPLVAIGGTNIADFSVTTQPAATITAGGSTTFTVTFTPGAAGARAATVSIANNDADENPYNFSIAGTGTTAPEINLVGKGNSIVDGDTTPSNTDDTDFTKTKLDGGTVTRTFTIQNTGTGDLTLSGSRVAISGANASDFTLGPQPPATIPAGGSATFTVTFDPSTGGTKTATVTITSNDANEGTYDFAILGVGVPPPGAPRNVRAN